MNDNDLNNKLIELDNKIADLQKQIKQYYAEKRDDTYRIDMESDGKVDNQPISKEMAKQIIASFEQNYDEQSVKNIEQHRERVGYSHPDVIKYDNAKKQVDDLRERFLL